MGRLHVAAPAARMQKLPVPVLGEQPSLKAYVTANLGSSRRRGSEVMSSRPAGWDFDVPRVQFVVEGAFTGVQHLGNFAPGLALNL
jgi:hypothetical protein